jgi:hypothetical protein
MLFGQLHDDRSRRHSGALSHIIHTQLDKVAASQFAVDGQIEQCEFPSSLGQLKSDPDRPNFLQLERRLLPD